MFLNKLSVRSRFVLCLLLIVSLVSVSQASITATGSFMPADQSTWNSNTSLTIAFNANATLTINGGSDLYSGYGYLAWSEGYTGRVTVTGSGSTWACSNNLLIGIDGTGLLNITSGGEVKAADTSIGSDSINPKTATAAVVIDGSGSKLTGTGSISVGNNSAGTLSLTKGATVSGTDAAIGIESGVTGTVTIDGSGSLWTGRGALCAGVYGTGTLKITNGGQMTVGSGLVSIGQYAGSTGTITIDGSGSTLTQNHYGYVGYGGAGVLNITNGGKVIDNSGSSTIGFESTSTGKVLVEGTGSTWTLSDTLNLGISGAGTVTISKGGLVMVKGTLWFGPYSNKGSIYMISGGKLALKGQAASSISAFLGLIQGSPVIYVWNAATSTWKNITTLTQGTNYTLTYQTSGTLAGYTVLTVTGSPLAGDANLDGRVDVGDLGILAANYGVTSGAIWSMADFNGDAKVDVGDLGILAANYGRGTSGADFNADYAKVFGAADTSGFDSSDGIAITSADDETATSLCSLIGLSLIAGLLSLLLFGNSRFKM
jgi:T5SS/PEP-CTERM-associated repeat protein